jgi:mycothiol synthase
MLNVLIRPAASGDAAAACLLSAQTLSFDPDAAQLPGSLLDLAAWPAEIVDRRLGLVAENDGELIAISFGGVQERASAVVGGIDLLAVLPQAQGRGVGLAMLAEMEKQLAARGATEIRLGYSAPVYLWPGIDPRYTVMTCLADRAGYERFADAVDLVANLSVLPLDTAEDERRLAAAGIAVRRAGPADAGGVVDWLRGGPWGGSSWPVEAAVAMAAIPSACHVASNDAGYVGFACHGVNRAGWFGPMGTLKEYRRQGIGNVLLLRCLADIADAGHATAQISWAGPVRYYSRAVAARVDRVYWAYRKRLATG